MARTEGALLRSEQERDSSLRGGLSNRVVGLRRYDRKQPARRRHGDSAGPLDPGGRWRSAKLTSPGKGRAVGSGGPPSAGVGVAPTTSPRLSWPSGRRMESCDRRRSGNSALANRRVGSCAKSEKFSGCSSVLRPIWFENRLGCLAHLGLHRCERSM